MSEKGDIKLQSPEGTAAANTLPCDEETGDVIELSEAYTAEEEKAVLRKIDRTILPMVSCS